MSVTDLAIGTVESVTDTDFADLPEQMQADLLDWWTRYLIWRRDREVVISSAEEPRCEGSTDSRCPTLRPHYHLA